MSTNFPTSIDSLTNPASTDSVATVDHAAQHANANDAIEALEAKVGVNSSAVTTSLDYKVSNASSVSPGHKHALADLTDASTVTTLTGSQTLTNKTLTSPTINTPTMTAPVLGAATGTSLVLSSFLNEAKGADIASATTTDIGAATGTYVNVTGTTTITGLGTVQAGTRRVVNFTGALILTYNATSLILPTAANITTAAGDTAVFVSLGSGNWKCVDYTRASGAALTASAGSATAIDIATSSWQTIQLPKSDLATGTHTYTGIIEGFNSGAADGQAIQWYLPNIRGGTTALLRFTDVKRLIMRIQYARVSGTSLIGFGFADQGSYLGDTQTTAGERVGFTWTDSTTLYCVTSDGTGTPTATSVSSPPTSANWNEYIIDWDDENTNAKFYVNGTLVATHTTELPTTTANCRAAVGIGGTIVGNFTYPVVSIKQV